MYPYSVPQCSQEKSSDVPSALLLNSFTSRNLQTCQVHSYSVPIVWAFNTTNLSRLAFNTKDCVTPAFNTEVLGHPGVQYQSFLARFNCFWVLLRCHSLFISRVKTNKRDIVDTKDSQVQSASGSQVIAWSPPASFLCINI